MSEVLSHKYRVPYFTGQTYGKSNLDPKPVYPHKQTSFPSIPEIMIKAKSSLNLKPAKITWVLNGEETKFDLPQPVCLLFDYTVWGGFDYWPVSHPFGGLFGLEVP